MDFRHHVEILSRETDLARSLGAISLLDVRTRSCSVPFSRAATVCEPRSDSSLDTISGVIQYLAESRKFDSSVWIKRRASVQKVSISTPDGTGSAYKLIEDTTASNSHYVESEHVSLLATRGCFIVKAAEITEVSVRYIRDNGTAFGGANARMDLLTGNVTSGVLDVESLSNGWWKVTARPDGTATTNVAIRISLVKGGTETYTGDGSSGVYILAANMTNTASPTPLVDRVGSQIPWGPRGVRLDPSWKNFWLTRSGFTTGTCSDGTITDVSGVSCTRFTPNSGSQSFPTVGRSPQTISLAQGSSTDLALSGYLYPSVPGSVSLEPFLVVELSTNGVSQIYATAQIDPSTGSIKSKTLPAGFSEKSPLTTTAVGNGFRFEWVITYTQDATLRNTLIAYLQARTSAGNGVYTADGISALQYSHLSASFTSYIVPPTQALTADLTVPSFTFGNLLSSLGIILGSSYTIGVEYTSVTDAQEKVVFGMSSGAFAESVYFTHNNSVSRQSFAMISGGAAQFENMSTTSLSGVLQKAVVRVKANDSMGSFNGGSILSDSSCVLPTGLTNFTIGKAPWGGNANDFSGWISRIYLIPYDTASSTHLQSLSYVDLVSQLGGQYVLDTRSRNCTVPFNRLATVYEPQPNGEYQSYSGSQVPWSTNGVQIDGAWQNSCLWGCEINVNRSWVVSAALNSDLNSGEISSPGSGISYTRLTTLGGSAPHVYRTISVTPGSVMQMSMLVRLGTMTAGEFKVAFYDSIAATFISSEVTTTSPLNSTGWTRCDFTVTIPAGCTSARFYPFRNSAALASGKTVYLSLVNVTNTNYPVPLTKAEADPVDASQPSFAGTVSEIGVPGLGSSYTLFAEYSTVPRSSYLANRNIVQLDNNSSGNRSILRWNNAANTPTAYIVSSGVTQFTGSSTGSEGSLVKHALRVSASSPRSSLNGTLNSGTLSITLPPTPTHIRLGYGLGGEPMGGVLRRVAIFPNVELADKYLAALGSA